MIDAARSAPPVENRRRPAAPVSRHDDAFERVLSHLSRALAGTGAEAPSRLERLAEWERPTSRLLRVRGVTAGGAVVYFVRIFKLRPDGPDRPTLEARISREFATTRRLWQALPRHEGLSTVRPVACFPEHLALVTEESPGRTLSALLESTAAGYPTARALGSGEQALSRVGAWIRAFQATDTTGTYLLDDLRRYIDVRLCKLVGAARASFTERDRAAVLRYFDTTAADVPASDLVETVVHGDLAPPNVIVDGPRIVVLDFAMCGRGSRYHDVSRLVVQLELLLMKPWFRPAAVARLQRAVMQGFDPGARLDAPLFSLLVLMHRTNHFATLALRPAAPAARIYNWYVRRRHRRWLDALVRPTA